MTREVPWITLGDPQMPNVCVGKALVSVLEEHGIHLGRGKAQALLKKISDLPRRSPEVVLELTTETLGSHGFEVAPMKLSGAREALELVRSGKSVLVGIYRDPEDIESGRAHMDHLVGECRWDPGLVSTNNASHAYSMSDLDWGMEEVGRRCSYNALVVKQKMVEDSVEPVIHPEQPPIGTLPRRARPGVVSHEPKMAAPVSPSRISDQQWQEDYNLHVTTMRRLGIRSH